MFSSVLFLAVTIIHLKGVSSLWCFHCSEFDIVKLSNNEKTLINCPTICDNIEQWWRNGSGKKHLTFKSTNKTEHCIIGTIGDKLVYQVFLIYIIISAFTPVNPYGVLSVLASLFQFLQSYHKMSSIKVTWYVWRVKICILGHPQTP